VNQSDGQEDAMQDQPGDSQETSETILYVGTDAGLPHRIRPLLNEQGLRLTACSDLDALRTQCPAHDWTALILDSALLASDQTVQSFMAALAQGGAPIRNLVVIAHTKDIGLRLQALRAGAAAFFTAPVGSRALVERLCALCAPRTAALGRVLVVEDDPMQALLVERILSAAGYTVRTQGDALQVLAVIEDFQPELILMDLNMPGANGAELTAIIREHEVFASVPILFLSSERDPVRQSDALSMGGDAFIAKPIRPDLLIKAVTQRLETMRAVRGRLRLAEHQDPVTGLASRHYFVSCLERAIAEPGIGEAGNGLLLIALDGATSIDERIGTGGAELVRARAGSTIPARLESGELAVRLDHHRHAVLLRRAGADALLAAAEGLRAAVAAAPLKIGGQSLTVSVSIGVGLFHPAAGDAITVISRAEKACAQAQGAGGDRVVMYRPFVPGPGDTLHEQRIGALIDRALTGAEMEGGFRLFYQPLVAVQSPSPQLMEVRLRLLERDAELIPDADYLPVATRGGRLCDIDRWLMLRALAALAGQAPTHPELRLLIPQHLDTLASDGWVLWFRNQLVSSGLTQQRPIIEVWLADLLQRPDDSAILLRMLHKLGVKVCLLDVDLTAAARDLVVELQPPLVKIAAATLHRAKPDELLRLITRLHQTGTEVIVGGVDDPARVGSIWASGADYVQGALIQEPLPDLTFDWTETVLNAEGGF
jgi:diguanylate cyclase (GGDEF)-like protein